MNLKSESVGGQNIEKMITYGGYWLIPPEIWEPLNKEFSFDFDPCPFPRPEGFDGLTVPWGRSNWVNPLYTKGSSISAWVRKAIEEQAKGHTSVLILPLDRWVMRLLSAGAEVRSIGFHDWIHTIDGTRRRGSRPSFLFVLRGGEITV